MATVSFLALYLLGMLLFTCRFENERYSVVLVYGLHIGRANVSKYVGEHPEDILAVQRDMNCAKVTYPSLTLSYAHVDPYFMTEYIRAESETSFSRYYSYVTVNRHASPDFVDSSDLLYGVAVVEGFADSQMHVCVREEVFEGFPIPDIDPQITVDWVAFYSSFSKRLESDLLSIFLDSNNQYNCDAIFFDGAVDYKTIIINEAVFDAVFPVLVDAIWIDSYIFEFYSSLQRKLTICTHTYVPFKKEYELEVAVTGLDETGTVNNGVPPLGGTYLTENGSVKLKDTGDTENDWMLICIDKPFIQSYMSTPYVFISVSFRDKSSNDSIEPAIVGWVEFVNEVGFRACVRRPGYVSKIPVDASIPYLEYLVISEDGIYDVEAYVFRDDVHLITLELKHVSGIRALENRIPSLSRGFRHLLLAEMDGLTNGTLLVDNVAAVPTTETAYLFFIYEYTNGHGSEIIDALNDVFGDGYFPYVNSVADLAELMEVVYPNGQPRMNDEKVMVNFWIDHPCPVGPFTNGACSLEACDGRSVTGMKNITREKLTVHDSSFCPPLRREVPCNLPPCTMQEMLLWRTY